MSIDQVGKGLRLPESLRDQLLDFRRRVWSTKTVEALAIAACGLLTAYLAVFAIDRALETPAWVRGALLATAVVIGMVVPLYAYRWIWRRRRLEQLARLLSQKQPQAVFDLLGGSGISQFAAEPGDVGGVFQSCFADQYVHAIFMT